VNLSTVQVELLYDLLSTERDKMLEVFRQVREEGVGVHEMVIRVSTMS
jgi:hypothetical protein